jgi:predicted O-linked N-acetylglucosamine transferase (SPINDLY family)
LIFAPRVSNLDHLARHQLADLSLDTLPCNAHTTASDALWSGLPLLTCSGNSFPGRVAHSLLSSLELSDLVAYSLGEYESKAVEIALHPELLIAITRRLEENKSKLALFNAQDYTLSLEKAYWLTQQRFLNALHPDHIDVEY